MKLDDEFKKKACEQLLESVNSRIEELQTPMEEELLVFWKSKILEEIFRDYTQTDGISHEDFGISKNTSVQIPDNPNDSDMIKKYRVLAKQLQTLLDKSNFAGSDS